MAIVPYDQRDGFIWLNGQLVPWGDARVHVLTHGLHYASAVFEVPENPPDWKVLLVLPDAPKTSRGAVLTPLEGGRWIVLVDGRHGRSRALVVHSTVVHSAAFALGHPAESPGCSQCRQRDLSSALHARAECGTWCTTSEG